MHQPTNPPDGHQSPEQPEPQTCCDCGYLTRQPVKVGEAWATGGAGRDVYACPEHATRYPASDADSTIAAACRLDDCETCHGNLDLPGVPGGIPVPLMRCSCRCHKRR